MIRLRLYTTLGCHLCEQLEALLAELCGEAYRLERVEISEDDVLIERYGIRIPVLVDEDGEELDRGFDPERLAAWLAERGWLAEDAWRRLQASGEDERAGVTGSHYRGGRRFLG